MGCFKAGYVPTNDHTIKFLTLSMHFDRISVLKCNFCRLVETENIGRAHVEFSQHLMEQVEKSMREFREEQKNKRKSVQVLLPKNIATTA